LAGGGSAYGAGEAAVGISGFAYGDGGSAFPGGGVAPGKSGFAGDNGGSRVGVGGPAFADGGRELAATSRVIAVAQ